MSDEKITTNTKEELGKLFGKDSKLFKIPAIGDLIKGRVLNVSKNEVRLDIEGLTTGIIRGDELYNDLDEYKNLKENDEVEATILELDNENGEMELSFRAAGETKTWEELQKSIKERKIVKGIIKEANKGGLIIKIFSMEAFLPVSQLAGEHYPKVHGGDKGKILEKLKKLINQEIFVKVMSASEQGEVVIVSEKEVAVEMQNEVMAQFKLGDIIEGIITVITDFGAFVKIDKKIISDEQETNITPAEGLIHISEIAWQKIENLKNHMKEGQRIKAKIINIDGIKIFLSAKQLSVNPWNEAKNKYSIGQTIIGEIVKVNPYGLIVKLDEELQGLAHISQMSGGNYPNIEKIAKIGDKKEFIIISMNIENHRIGLSLKEEAESIAEETTKKEAEEEEPKKSVKTIKTKRKNTKKQPAEDENKNETITS
ncbi:MAG: S1 RNA-binding domain-containing protein [bacterium]